MSATAENIASQDSAGRALGRLARTFPAQMEALNRYRNESEPAMTVQNVSVQDGGKAIIGNVMQHTSVVDSNQRGATTASDARIPEIPDRGAEQHESVAAERHESVAARREVLA